METQISIQFSSEVFRYNGKLCADSAIFDVFWLDGDDVSKCMQIGKYGHSYKDTVKLHILSGSEVTIRTKRTILNDSISDTELHVITLNPTIDTFYIFDTLYDVSKNESIFRCEKKEI